VGHASGYINPLTDADDQIGGLWAVIATAFVFRTSQAESIIAAKTRVAATALSFVLGFAYVLFLPSHAWGLAALIGVGTLVLTSAGQSRGCRRRRDHHGCRRGYCRIRSAPSVATADAMLSS
jgi:hypothetical protein